MLGRQWEKPWGLVQVAAQRSCRLTAASECANRAVDRAITQRVSSPADRVVLFRIVSVEAQSDLHLMQPFGDPQD